VQRWQRRRQQTRFEGLERPASIEIFLQGAKAATRNTARRTPSSSLRLAERHLGQTFA